MAENKVYNIINQEFDNRLDLAVIQYLCEQVGIDRAKRITDEEIEAIEGNAFMTKGFCQAMVRCARRIALECDFIKDVVPYIVDNFGHLTGHITQKRTEEILDRYISYVDHEPSELQWTLYNACECTDEELCDLGFGYLIKESEDEV